jgi:hypothetical protein
LYFFGTVSASLSQSKKDIDLLEAKIPGPWRFFFFLGQTCRASNPVSDNVVLIYRSQTIFFFYITTTTTLARKGGK